MSDYSIHWNIFWNQTLARLLTKLATYFLTAIIFEGRCSLSLLSKVIVYKQTIKFLNLTLPVNGSTDLFLSFLNENEGFDNKLYTGMIKIDLSNTFNAINHKILRGRLQSIAFQNILSAGMNRILESITHMESVTRGVPQGSKFDLCQWYEPSCRFQHVPIRRWFLLALIA